MGSSRRIRSFGNWLRGCNPEQHERSGAMSSPEKSSVCRRRPTDPVVPQACEHPKRTLCAPRNRADARSNWLLATPNSWAAERFAWRRPGQGS